MPSLRPNALIAIVVTALTAVIGAWSDAAGADRLWYLPAGLLLLGLAYERWVTGRAGIELRVQPAGRWHLAEAAGFAVEVEQRGRRTVELEVALDAPAGVEVVRSVRTLRLEPELRERLELRAVPRRLGRLPWPTLRGRVGGPLGLGWWPRPLPVPTAVSVEPGLLGPRAAMAGDAAAGDRSSVRRGAGGEILQLRPYRPGDPMRAIDWKATARTRRLTARDFIEDQNLEVVIGIDAGRSSGVWCGELDRLGHYVNLAARLAERATAQDDRIGLVVYGDQPLAALRPERGLLAVRRVRALLAALEPQRTDSNPIHAAARVRALVRRRCLVILLTDIDDVTGGSQLSSAVRLLVPPHLLVIAGLKSAASEARSAEPSAGWRDPYWALAREELRVRRERSIAALHSLGASALIARPEVVETAVFDTYARFRRERRI